MSLAVAFKGPEGIVLAADSRVTMQVPLGQPQPIPGAPPNVPHVLTVVPSYFDNAHKLLSMKCQPFVGIVTYGAGAIGANDPRTAHSFLPEFEAHLTQVAGEDGEGNQNRLSTLKVSEEIAAFFGQQWVSAGMPPAPLPPGVQALTFLIGGFDDGEPYGHVYEVAVPDKLIPEEKIPFSPTFGGQIELMTRLFAGFDPRALQLAKDQLQLDDVQTAALQAVWQSNLSLPIPYQFLPLQDCVDLSTAIVGMTMEVQAWMFGIRGVGGAIDVATITREEGLKHVRQKTIHVYK